MTIITVHITDKEISNRLRTIEHDIQVTQRYLHELEDLHRDYTMLLIQKQRK